MSARVWMSMGVSEGLGGPAQSLMSLNAVVMTVLTCIVDKQSLSVLQLFSLISGITGAFIIAMGDIIAQKFTGNTAKSKVHDNTVINSEDVNV